MRARTGKVLPVLLLTYGVATLVHFVHNAELIADYPNMPAKWTSTHVYVSWLGLTGVGIFGWYLLTRGQQLAGLLSVAAYAVLGLASLGHYALAPMSAHAASMNATILFDVTTATLLLIASLRLIALHVLPRNRH